MLMVSKTIANKNPQRPLCSRVMGDEEGTGIRFGKVSGEKRGTDNRSRRDRLLGLI